jgi:peptidoglycan/xylan/chitin deacetylase (PgdA/CDA1 family)
MTVRVRRSLLQTFVLLSVPAFLGGCSKIEAPATEQVEILSEPGFLLRGDSTRISATLLDAEGNPVDDSTLVYNWTARPGRVLGRGREATYLAPDSAGVAMVAVAARRKGKVAAGAFREIPVYKQVILIKADDFAYDDGHADGLPDGWRLFFAYLEWKGIRASVGCVGERMADGSDAYFRKIAELGNSGRVEFFNHGWDHRLNVPLPGGGTFCEFRNTPYQEQFEHLLRTQTLMQARSGLVLHGFGAPGNAYDDATRRVVEEVVELDYWYFGSESTTKIDLKHSADIDNAAGKPDYDTFVTTYPSDAKYIVYQVHPWFWDMKKLNVFDRCINDLTARGATFMLPGEFCRKIQEQRRERAEHQAAPPGPGESIRGR